MTAPGPHPRRQQALAATCLLVRWLLGALFIYMGLNKTLHPVEFLKLVRQYDLTDNSLLLNLVAGGLPWFEVWCGLLLVAGVAVRGVALLLVAMLVPFSLVVLRRALHLHETGGLPFCMIKFDCGCGTGEVLICRKLAENAMLVLLSLGLIVRRHHPLGLFKAAPPD
jgi:uncharacterized membrane protein YphA (DoxX/SURF4 family)